MHAFNCQVAALQLQIHPDRQLNWQQTVEQIQAAKQQGADLIVLPELHADPYFCQTEDPAKFALAEPIPGPLTEQLSVLAKQLQIVLVASLFERRQAGIYHNTAVVFERDGQIAGLYRKMHIPDDPDYYEKFYFTPGDLGFTPIQTSLGKLGLLICWDQWFPEAARLMALAGADILIYPTAIGWDPRDEHAEQQRQLESWQTIQRSHAIANGIPVIACNRCGLEPHPDNTRPGIDFWGHSFIAGADGEFIAQAQQSVEIISAKLNGKDSETIRQRWPFLRDRRVDRYQNLNKISF